jgi:hypothetical protein
MFGINVGRIFASSVVRKLAYVLVALVLGMVGIGRASAQAYGESSYSQCTNTADPETHLCHTAQDAYAQSKAAMVALLARYGVTGTPFFAGENSTGGTYNLPGHHVTYWAKKPDGSNYNEGIFYAGRDYFDAEKCPTGVTWDDINKVCGSPCDDKPNLGAMANRGGDTMCKDGCTYKQDTSTGGLNVCFGSGPDSFCSAKSWKATGATCSTPTPPPMEYKPDKPVCVSMMGGNATECVKPDGTHCMVGARGTTLCWSLGETGPRVTADGKDGGDRQKSPNTPNPPPNMKDPVVTGNSTTTINGDTYNTNNYGGSGSSGGQGNAGSGGNDPGAGGDGKDASKDPKPTGGPGPGLGRLYEAKTDTAASVYSDFKTRMAAAPIANAATGFFTAPSGGGCPTWTIPATDWYGSMSFDAHCGGAFGAILGYCGFLVLAAAAFGAFRIAFY